MVIWFRRESCPGAEMAARAVLPPGTARPSSETSRWNGGKLANRNARSRADRNVPIDQLPIRVSARCRVMYDVSLSLGSRVLYFILDDKANEAGEVWWHWRKLAVLLGMSRTRFFEIVLELQTAGILLIRREGRRCYYNIHSFRKSGIIGEFHSAKADDSFRKSGTNEDSILLVNQFYETVAPYKAEIPETEPLCYRCRDTGWEVLDPRKICKWRCAAGLRVDREEARSK